MEKTEVQHEVHLEAAVKLLSGDLAQEASKSGIDNTLQRWIADLKATHNAELHSLVTDLQSLKALLHGGTYDAGQVSTLLHSLGNGTAKAAQFADDNIRPHVEKLSAALIAAAGQVQSTNNTTPAEDLKNNSRNNG
ncbi:hypothetical protein MRB53_041969 [Persea americana]|nr:hypothetical protein MRB53_041969 [Persea americana]